MTLAPLQLDDLTWDVMVAAIRRRIPAESAGNWTLHAPVDPGITLLELFAYLVEQRLYWLNQVPDAFVVAGLGLLGLDGPPPGRARATPPPWSPDHPADVPPPAVLTWAYADGAQVPIDAAQVQDGTQGLRRSGVVRLPVPASWNSGPGVRTLLLSTNQATFAAPPRLQQLRVNVAAARHRQEFSPPVLDALDGASS